MIDFLYHICHEEIFEALPRYDGFVIIEFSGMCVCVCVCVCVCLCMYVCTYIHYIHQACKSIVSFNLIVNSSPFSSLYCHTPPCN